MSQLNPEDTLIVVIFGSSTRLELGQDLNLEPIHAARGHRTDARHKPKMSPEASGFGLEMLSKNYEGRRRRQAEFQRVELSLILRNNTAQQGTKSWSFPGDQDS